MSMTTAAPLELTGQYGDLYNEIVRPDRKYTISHYLRTHWAPLLGAARVWLIVALRQRCFWNHKQDWCVVDKQTLAREAGISVRSANRIIKEEGYVSWFFTKTRRRRYSQRAGRTVNAPNRYRVMLDDPLTPGDQRRLAVCLRQAAANRSTLEALQSLTALSGVQLRAALAEVAQEQVDDLPTRPAAYVFDVVAAHCSLPPPESAEYAPIVHAASILHNTLTRPERVYMGNQYFRLNWLPALGPVLALLVVNLRARCYWNEQTGELRNTCRANWAQLAQELGCTSRQLRNLRKSPDLPHFFLAEGRGAAPIRFQVKMPDPLTPDDRLRFDQKSRHPASTRVDPETGQLGLPEPDAEILAQKQAEVLAHGERKKWRIEGLGAEILAQPGGNFGTCLKIQIITFTPQGLGETTITPSQPLSRQTAWTPAEAANIAAAVRLQLLSCLTIQEPNKTKIVQAQVRCADIAAWGLYTLTQPGLSKNRAGYIYNRLLKQDRPPPDCLALVALAPSEWRTLDRAMQRSDAQLAASLGDLADVRRWMQLLAPVWPTLRRDFGAVDVEAIEVKAERAVDLPPEWRALLRGDERLEQRDGVVRVIIDDLYQAYRLWRQLPPQPRVRLALAEQPGVALPLATDRLPGRRVTPIAARDWEMVIKELQWQMPQNVFARWWKTTRPLGLVADDAGDQDVAWLGVFSSQTQQWLSSRQAGLAARTLSGVLERPLRVHFFVCVQETAVLTPG